MGAKSLKQHSFLKLGISLFFFILFYILAFSEIVFAGDGIPPWMVKVESTYKCDQTIVAVPCKAAIHGAGFLIYIPASEKLDNKAHYLVMTDAHLSNGNYDSDSLKLSYRYKNIWNKLNLIKISGQLKRLSDNLNDIDIIEVEKPLGIDDKSMFRYNYIVDSPQKSYFWTQDDTAGKGYNEVTVADDFFVIAPPDLSKTPERFNSARYNVNFSRGATTAEILRKDAEPVKGLNWTSYGKEFLTQSHIVGGMSGSPLLKRVPGELMVLGLSKRYHRYFNRSYFSSFHKLSELLLEFAERHLVSSSSSFKPGHNFYTWSFIPFIGTFLKDVKNGVSEFSSASLNSGTFDFINSGGHDTSDGGGGHDTSDGGIHNTATGGLNSIVKSQLRMRHGMEFMHQQILGFHVKMPSVSDESETAPETVLNIYGNLDAIEFIKDYKDVFKKTYDKDIQIDYISKTTDLKQLFKTKLKNYPEFTDLFSIQEKLKSTKAFSTDLQDKVIEKYNSGRSELFGVPMCLLNKSSVDRLYSQSSNQSVELAVLKTSGVKAPSELEIKNAYVSLDVPMDLTWHKARNTGTDSELVYDAKGLFFVNLSDPICASLNCPQIFALNKAPYISIKWKEEREATVANCFVLQDHRFFERLRSKKLTSEEL